MQCCLFASPQKLNACLGSPRDLGKPHLHADHAHTIRKLPHSYMRGGLHSRCFCCIPHCCLSLTLLSLLLLLLLVLLVFLMLAAAGASGVSHACCC